MTDKKTIRREIGALKRTLTREQIDRWSRELTERFLALDEYKRASSLYAYLPYNQEVDTLPILRQALADGKRVAVPKVYGEVMRFIPLDDLTKVAIGSFGIPEPIADGPEADDGDALILMPGLAFDRKGRRIGYGGGYYDRYCREHPGHRTVALCYPFQLFERLETEAHDIPVDRVLCAEEKPEQ